MIIRDREGEGATPPPIPPNSPPNLGCLDKTLGARYTICMWPSYKSPTCVQQDVSSISL